MVNLLQTDSLSTRPSHLARAACLWILLATWFSGAETVTAEVLSADPEEVTSLAVPWRFAGGDGLRRATAELADDGWREIEIPTGFGREDARARISWYRLTVRLSPRGRPLGAEERKALRLGLTLGKIDSAYEVYVGGRLLGGVGSLPPEPRMDYDRHRIYPIPSSAVDPDGRLVLALRVWKSPQTRGTVGGPHEGPFYLGPIEQLTQQELLSELPHLILACFFLFLGFFHLELYRRRPPLRSYLWFAVSAILLAGYTIFRTQWKYLLSDRFIVMKEIEYLIIFLMLASFVELLWPLLGLRVSRPLRVVQIISIGLGIVAAATPGLALNIRLLPLYQAALVGLTLLGIGAIFREAWREHPEARIIAVGAIFFCAGFLNDVAVDRGFVQSPRLATFGFGFLVLSIAASLANLFLRTHEELESLQKTLERRVDERTRQLLEANLAKSRFLATMSHEIRTPLNGVIGTLRLLLGTPLNEEQREYANAARRSGDLLLALVDDILDFSKIEAGKVELHERPFSVRKVIDNALAILTPSAQEKGIELAAEMDSGLPETVLGDAMRLRQILVNLVANAVKFTDQGTVRLKLQLGGTAQNGRLLCHFQVIDTGIGIPEDRLDRLFESFSQVDSSDSRRFGGTGLGLAICRRLTETMNGRIWCESEAGRGSTFHVVVPLLPRDDSADESRSGIFEMPKLPPLDVLLAEDDQINQLVAVKMLQAMGLHPDVAENGHEVLAKLEEKKGDGDGGGDGYDVIVLDVQMPEMDGLETTRQIRTLSAGDVSRRPWIIALTANAVRGDRERCLEAGMNDYLTKPVEPEALREAMLRAMAALPVERRSTLEKPELPSGAGE